MANNNLGFEMTIKANDGTLVPLYPQTIKDQVLGWNIGQVFGPYQFTLTSSGWSNNQQTVNLNGVSSEDKVTCVKVLSGTQAEMEQQDQSYNLLNPLIGVESLQNQIRFTCTSTPTSDFTVQISWTR